MKKISCLAPLLTISGGLFSQVDDAGSGHAISFDGVDDYIDLGNIYDDLLLPASVSAWIYQDFYSGYISPILEAISKMV